MVISPPEALRPILLKLDRANVHFDDFKATLGIGPKSKLPPTVSGLDLQDDGTLEYSTTAPIPGPESGIILGEGLHHLRTCLDHLVYALVARKHDPTICEKEKILFPLFKAVNDFESDRRIGKLREKILPQLIGSSELAAIEDAQPYKRNPTNPTADTLYILSQLNNIDKHRIVLVLDQAIAVMGHVEVGGVQTPFSSGKQPVKSGTNVLDIGGPLPKPPFGVQVDDLTPYVVFAETGGLCDNLSVFPLYRKMETAVREVVADFYRFF